jgi:hypothetical protein
MRQLREPEGSGNDAGWLFALTGKAADAVQKIATGLGEAMTEIERTKERWWEAEVHRTAGEIGLKSPEPDAAKAEV